jgi:hypothetical protein
MQYSLPIKPSPNLPNDNRSIYTLACAFEGTNVSVGRGTEKQFQIYGSPYLPKVILVLFPKPIWNKIQRTMGNNCFWKIYRMNTDYANLN